MLILDMVHHNPGEARFESRFNDPAYLRKLGYNGKVYSLFESPVLAVDWNGLYPGTMTGKAEAWRRELFARIKAQFARCRDNGLQILAMSDLLLFPRQLVADAGMEERFGNVAEPWVQEQLRNLLQLVFTQFPELDGLVVRIGETYLHDAPYHVGRIDNKKDAGKTIIPLLSLLREEICEKYHRTLIFRTWGAFDEDPTAYLMIAEAVLPHPKLVIAVKHCEEDFHRGNPFSRIIGFGPHPQLIEIQCAREYEGKGAYPNYLAHGIIDGFEEHRASRSLRSIGEFARRCPEKFAGIWTWSRGGGWEGPYLKDEFWPDLNARILARWGTDPALPEERIFSECCREHLRMTPENTVRFRRLCRLSEAAIVRGKASLLGYFPPWWTRDQYIGVPPLVPYDCKRFLTEKRQAVKMWEEMASIAQSFGGYIATSTQYGLQLFRIYEAVWNVRLGNDRSRWHRQYEEAWQNLENLAAAHPDCATLYERNVIRRLVSPFSADALMMDVAEKR